MSLSLYSFVQILGFQVVSLGNFMLYAQQRDNEVRSVVSHSEIQVQLFIQEVGVMSTIMDGEDMSHPDERVQILMRLIDNVRSLAKHDDFAGVENAFNEVASLKETLRSRDNEIRKLTELLDGFKAEEQSRLKNMEEGHEHTKHEILKAHREAVATVEEEKKMVEFEVSSAQTKTQEVQTAMDVLSQDHTTLQDKYIKLAEEYKRLKAKITRAEGEMQKLSKQVAAKNQIIEDDKREITEQGVAMSNIRSELNVFRVEKQSLADKLWNSENGLKKIEGFSQRLEEDNAEEMSHQFQELWLRCWKVVKRCFDEDLSESALSDPTAWKSLKDVSQFKHSIPLPPTNSRVAKNMRTAILLAILAASLARHIFTLTYQVEEDANLREIFLDLAVNNGAKEAHFRGIMASLPDQRETTVIRKRVQKVIREVIGRVQDILGPSELEPLRSELEPLVTEAAQIWKGIQRRRSRFEADIYARSNNPWEWKAIELNGDSETADEKEVSASDFTQDDAELILFPRVYIVDEERDTPVFAGVVLLASQLDSAKQEVEQIRTSSPFFATASLRTNRPGKVSRINSNDHSTSTGSDAFEG